MRKNIDLYVINKVREIRIKKGFTQEALSYQLGYSRSFVSSYENGTRKYNMQHLNEIAKVLKYSPKDFLPDNPIDEK